jgi:hypothetical protein
LRTDWSYYRWIYTVTGLRLWFYEKAEKKSWIYDRPHSFNPLKSKGYSLAHYIM